MWTENKHVGNVNIICDVNSRPGFLVVIKLNNGNQKQLLALTWILPSLPVLPSRFTREFCHAKKKQKKTNPSQNAAFQESCQLVECVRTTSPLKKTGKLAVFRGIVVKTWFVFLRQLRHLSWKAHFGRTGEGEEDAEEDTEEKQEVIHATAELIQPLDSQQAPIRCERRSWRWEEKGTWGYAVGFKLWP